MDKDLKTMLKLINWAVDHGYNPFDSTHTKPQISYKLLEALDGVVDNVSCILTELTKE